MGSAKISNVTKPKSIADRDAELWKPGVLVDFAYLYDVGTGPEVPKPRNGRHRVVPEALQRFKELVEEARGRKLTGRPRGKVLGDLGEYFAAIMFGIKLHAPNTQGSDGKLGDANVEVKTITPEKTRDTVRLKSTGDFRMIAVVKITDDFQFGARLIERRFLKKGDGKWIKLSWDEMVAGAGERALEGHRNFPLVRLLTANSRT